MIISGEVVKTSQLPKKTLALTDSLVALMSSPLETVTVPVSDFVSFVSTQIGGSLIEGVGSLNYLPKFTGTNTLGNSLIYDNGTNVGIGTTSPTDRLHIVDATNANIFARVTANGTNASAAWVAQNDQVDNVVYRVFGSGVTGTQMGVSLVRSASLMANLGGTGSFLLGTFSSTNFVLGTANVERARITTSGNFLIGTTVDAGYKLDVNGNLRIGSSIFGQGTTNTYYQIASSDYHHRFFTRTDVGAALERFTIEGGAVSGKAYFQNTNVGIGTTTPTNRLEVKPAQTAFDLNALADGTIALTNNSSGANAPTLGAKSLVGSQPGLSIVTGTPDTNTIDMLFSVRENDNTDFTTLTTPAFRFARFTTSLVDITRNGNVGIGTTAPATKLDVSGGDITVDSSRGMIFRSTSGYVKYNGSQLYNVSADSYDSNGYFRVRDNTGANTRFIVLDNGNVGIGTATPSSPLHVASSVTAASAIARGVNFSQTLTASANNDNLIGLDIQPTYSAGAFTGVTNIALRVNGNISPTSPNSASIGYASLPFNNGFFGGTVFANTLQNYNSHISFSLAYVTVGRFFTTTGNLLLQNGGTFTDAGYRLDVTGTIRATENIFLNSQKALVSLGNSVPIRSNLAGGSGYIVDVQSYNTLNGSNVEQGLITLSGTYAPTSVTGTPSFNGIYLAPTVNQTGGANGTTRGLYVNPTITSAATWRSIEWSNSAGWGLFGAGSAPNYLGGSLVMGTTTVNASASLQVDSTTKGFLPPRMTSAQILLISSPAEGLQVYNTDLKTICFYNGTAWQRVTSTAM